MLVPGRAGTGTEQAAEDARRGPRSGAAPHRRVPWGLEEGGGGGMLPLLLEFLWGLRRLLSAASSRQSWPGSPRLQMKVRAARGGDGGKGVGSAPALPPRAASRGCPLPWQRLPAAPHPFQPGDPDTVPCSSSCLTSSATHCTGPLALGQPGCSSLNPTGVFWGAPASPCPLGACRLWKCQWCFRGCPLERRQAGEGTLPPSSHHAFCPQGG